MKNLFTAILVFATKQSKENQILQEVKWTRDRKIEPYPNGLRKSRCIKFKNPAKFEWNIESLVKILLRIEKKKKKSSEYKQFKKIIKKKALLKLTHWNNYSCYHTQQQP